MNGVKSTCVLLWIIAIASLCASCSQYFYRSLWDLWFHSVDHTQCVARSLLVTANSCRLYHVMYHQLNIYSKFGSRQRLFAFDIFLNTGMIDVGCNFQPHPHMRLPWWHVYSLGFLLDRYNHTSSDCLNIVEHYLFV